MCYTCGVGVFGADRLWKHTLEQCRYNRSRLDTTISKAEVSCAARTLCGSHHSVVFSDAIEIFRTPYMASHWVGSAAEVNRPRCRALLRVKSDIGISRLGPGDGKRTRLTVYGRWRLRACLVYMYISEGDGDGMVIVLKITASTVGWNDWLKSQ